MSKSGQYSAESPPPYPGTLIPLSLPVVAPASVQQKSKHLITVNEMTSCRTNNATTVKVCPQCQMPLVNVDNSKRFILIVLLIIITFPISLVYLCCMPPLKHDDDEHSSRTYNINCKMKVND
ncbi:E3 ubiquitin-protein ligase sina [Trichinella pseudospiralis]